MAPPILSAEEDRRNQRRKIVMGRGAGRTIGTYPAYPFDVATYNVSPGGMMAHCQPDIGPMIFPGDRLELSIPIGGAPDPSAEMGSVRGRVAWSAPGTFDNPRLPRLEQPLGNHWAFGIEFDQVQLHVIEALMSRA